MNNAIAQALRNDEFEPYYQPIVAFSDGRLKGAEALARWRRSKEEVFEPGVFMRPLEEMGLVSTLLLVMLKKAAQCCKRGGPGLSVAVNLSLKPLTDTTLGARAMEVVHAVGVEPRRITFEVTDSAEAATLAIALENLSRLRMLGFGLSIDHGGTADSARHLGRIPLTELKIDQSSVREAASPDASRALIESGVATARKQKLTAVVEGVETEDELRIAGELGCDLAQGRYIASPMDEASYLKWARQWNPAKHL